MLNVSIMEQPMIHLSRRQCLRLVTVSLIPAAAAACGLTTGAERPTAALTPRPLPIPTEEAAGAATPTALPGPLASGATVGITPNNAFYSVAITQRNDWLKEPSYILTVSGAVLSPLKLTLGDLKSLPAVEQMRTLECIGNPAGGQLIGNAIWKGVRLSDVLAKAGLTSAAVEIKLTSADAFYTTIPVALATRQDSLLVYEMNGVPLPDEHGAPLRCLFPARYGMKQPKWITSIEATVQPSLGYWERQGWSNDAIVQVNSQIRTPSSGEVVAAETYRISGTIFTNESGVAKLDVSTDAGKTWNTARLLRGPTPLAWSEWSYDWQPSTAGDATIIARATDNDGNQQPLVTERFMSPDGNIEGVSTAHRISISVRK